MSKVLLVEDDAMIREAFSIILKLRGEYEVTVAENGQAALDLCKINTYDVILLDIMMPVLDGIGFLKQHRTLFPEATVKIIIMSNLSSGTELSQAQDFNVERSVLKSSLTPATLTAIVAEALESQTSLGQGLHSPTTNDPPNNSGDASSPAGVTY